MTLEQLQAKIERLWNDIRTLKNGKLFPNKIYLHHSGGNAGIFTDNLYHQQRWNSISSLGWYLGYHYYIDKTGKIWQTRRDDEEGIHTLWHNYRSIGICLEGNMEIDYPTPKQILSLIELFNEHKIFGINKNDIKGHKEVCQTLCPGKHLQDWLIQYKNI